MREIRLPKKRRFSNDSQYAQYDKGFNHALMICAVRLPRADRSQWRNRLGVMVSLLVQV
jgi:hypothetical protein